MVILFPFIELRQSLPSKVAAISPFVDQLMPFTLKSRRANESETDIETALREALRMPLSTVTVRAPARTFT
jgi:hypothetical protein